MKRIYPLILCGIAWFCCLGSAQERPRLSLQKGHVVWSRVLLVAPLQDPNTLVTAASDGLVKIWDRPKGKVLRTIFDTEAFGEADNAEELVAAVIAPDKSWIATWGQSGSLRRYSLPEGALLSILEIGRSDRPILHTDGVSFYRNEENRIIRTDLQGKILAQTDGDTRASRPGLWSFSSDLVAVADGSGVTIYDKESLEQKAFRKLHSMPLGMSFEPESNKLAVVTTTAIAVLDGSSLEIESLLEVNAASHNKGAWPFWYDEQVYLSAYLKSEEETLRRVDFKNSTLVALGEAHLPYCLPTIENGQLYFGGLGGEGVVLDIKSGQEVARLKGDSSGFTALLLDETTGDLVTAELGPKVRRWGKATGRVVQEYDFGEGDLVSSLAISPDGKKLLAGKYTTGEVVCWDSQSGKELSRLKGQRNSSGMGVSLLKFFNDENYFLGSKSTEKLQLIRANSGTEVQSWDRKPSSLALNGARNRILLGERGSVFEAPLNSARDGLQIALPVKEAVIAVCYAPGERQAYALTYRGGLYLCDLSGGQKQATRLAKLPVYSVNHLEPTDTGFRVLAQGGKLLSLDKKGTVLSTLQLEERFVAVPVYLSNGRLVAIGPNRVLDFFDATSGELLAKVTGVEESQGWVVLERSGEFDGNDLGLQAVAFELGNQVYGIEQFMNQYLRPGVLSRLLPSDSEAQDTRRTVPELTAGNVKVPPEVEILTPTQGSVIDTDTVTAKVKVTPRAHGAAGVSLFHNGHKLPETALKKLDERTYEFQFRPVQGINELRASAFDETKSVEARQDRVRFSAPNLKARAPRLHLLAVGVDTYESGLSLRFAKEDASAVAKLFESELYETGERKLLQDGEATLAGIKAAITSVASAAEPQDAFVFYLAGHGTVIGEDYYFLPTDVEVDSDESLRSTALSSQDLAEALSKVPATKQLLILDSCRSGAAAGVVSRYFASRAGLEEIRSQKLLARASGTFLIAATKGEDYAYEIPQLGHGVLTYALLEALGVLPEAEAARGKGAESEITVNDLLRSVSSEVPKLSQQYQGVRQQVIQYSSGQDFPIAK